VLAIYEKFYNIIGCLMVNLNWRVMVAVFLFTLALAVLIGSYLPRSIGFLIPIIGGLFAGYWVGGNYNDGIINGGIPVGLAGLLYTLGISGFVFYLVFGIIGGLIGFAIKERRLIKGVLR
jgi:hypothetical protein